MLLPDEVKGLARETIYARLRAGPCWAILRDGAVHVCPVRPSEVEDCIAALDRCAVIVARRRHERWYGPVVGFALEPAAVVVVLELEVDPIENGTLTTWVTSGVDAAIEWFRWRHPRVGAIEVSGVTRG